MSISQRSDKWTVELGNPLECREPTMIDLEQRSAEMSEALPSLPYLRAERALRHLTGFQRGGLLTAEVGEAPRSP